MPLVILSVIYFATRLYNLTILPIFTDEAIYIYWAKFIAQNHSNWFISLTDGKPPLLIWSIAFLLKLLPPSHYLLAGRLPAVFAGFFTLLGIYHLSFLLFSSRKLAIVASSLYILLPFTLLYDRMSLFDSLLTATSIWAIYFALKNRPLLWGLSLGLAFLSKPTAIIYWALSPLLLWLYTKKPHIKNSLIALTIGQLINNSLRISSVYFMMATKNQQFQRPIIDIIKDPLGITRNLHALFSWIAGYYTLPLLATGLLAFIFLFIKHRRTCFILFSLWLIPIVAFAIAGSTIFPRYILFTTPYFLIATAYLIHKFPPLIIVVIFLLRFDLSLLTTPYLAPIPDTDYHQYISDHPAGYGLDKIFAFIDSHDKPITIVTEGTFGVLPYALNLRYWDNPKITIVPRFPLSSLDQEIYDRAQTEPVYILLKDQEKIPNYLPLTPVIIATKPHGTTPFILAELSLPLPQTIVPTAP